MDADCIRFKTMKNRMIKQLISAVLCLALLFGVLPRFTASVYSEELDGPRIADFSILDNVIYSTYPDPLSWNLESIVKSIEVCQYYEPDVIQAGHSINTFYGEILIRVESDLFDPTSGEKVVLQDWMEIRGNTWTSSFTETPDSHTADSTSLYLKRCSDGTYRFQNDGTNLWVAFGSRMYSYRVIIIPDGETNNHKPSFNSDITNAYMEDTVTAGHEWSLNLKEIYEDSDADHLSFYVKSGDSDFTETGSVFKFTPEEANQTYSFDFKAKDMDFESDDIFHVTLTTTSNQTPVIVAEHNPGEYSCIVNRAWSLNLNDVFMDPDGDVLTYKVSVDGSPLSDTNGQYSYTPIDTGTVNFVFYAYDGINTSDAYQVMLTITEPGGPQIPDTWPRLERAYVADEGLTIDSTDGTDHVTIVSVDYKVYDQLIDNGDTVYGVHTLISSEINIHVDKALDPQKSYVLDYGKIEADTDYSEDWEDQGETPNGTFAAGEKSLVNMYAADFDYTIGIGWQLNIVEPEGPADITVVLPSENYPVEYTVSGNVITVTNNEPCKVGYIGDDGKYVVVNAVPVDGMQNTYSFTVDDPAVTEVMLAVKGDSNANGRFDGGDITKAKAVSLGKTTLSPGALFAADANGNGVFDGGDITRMKAVSLGKTSFEW